MSYQDRDEAFKDELRSLVMAGKRIEAVNRYGERMGGSLRAAVEAVDDVVRQQGISQRQTDSVEWDVISLLEASRKLEAIEFYQQRMGSSLEEAKQAVERIGTEHRIPTSRNNGCIVALSLVVAVLFGIAIAVGCNSFVKIGVEPRATDEAMQKGIPTFACRRPSR